MDHSEQRDRLGRTHEWGVRWDITEAIRSGTSVVVTHYYQRRTNDMDSPVVTDQRYRLVIKFQSANSIDDPWAVVPVYVVQEALHPNSPSDPCWLLEFAGTSHDQALAHLEGEIGRAHV